MSIEANGNSVESNVGRSARGRLTLANFLGWSCLLVVGCRAAPDAGSNGGSEPAAPTRAVASTVAALPGEAHTAPVVAAPSVTAASADSPSATASSPSSPGSASPSSKGSCHRDADCSVGSSCFFEDEGCAAAGRCRVSGTTRKCNVAIPMCSCARHETFFGAGGCAGSSVREPWDLYACSCKTDADCKAGQLCLPTNGMSTSRPGSTHECRDAVKK